MSVPVPNLKVSTHIPGPRPRLKSADCRPSNSGRNAALHSTCKSTLKSVINQGEIVALGVRTNSVWRNRAETAPTLYRYVSRLNSG
ncbi:hypothetical protein J6590_020660 [Homalodisca vitripennis]|nr:hypothetical protein J6590_020660 [Homalodisca vitripennis]